MPTKSPQPAEGNSMNALSEITTQSAIARLEDADYNGHSLTMLRRIAAAMNQRVEVRFVPLEEPQKRKGIRPDGLAKKTTAKRKAGKRLVGTPRRST
jgi:hypothetical protein